MYTYADDVNFAMIEADEVREETHREQQVDAMVIECQCIACRAYQLEECLPRRFAEYGMQMSAGKTTHRVQNGQLYRSVTNNSWKQCQREA